MADTPTQPAAPAVDTSAAGGSSPANGTLSASDFTSSGTGAAAPATGTPVATTENSGTAPTTGSNSNSSGTSGSADGLIKFSAGLDNLVSAQATAGAADIGALGGGGIGSAALSGEILTGGWISDDKLKQVAMEVTCFHSVPVNDGSSYYMAVDSIDATGGLATGRHGQPSSFDKSALEATKQALNGKDFKVGASFGICKAGGADGHGKEYFDKYYPDLGLTTSTIIKLRNANLLNAEVIVPTSATEGKAFRIKLADEGPWHDNAQSGLWILDVMSAFAMLDENGDTFSITAKTVSDLYKSNYKFPFANVKYDYINGVIPGYSPDAELGWNVGSTRTLDLIANKVNGLVGKCRVKFFIDPSHKAKAEEICGKTLPDDLFTCNATYSAGGVGVASGAAIAGVITAGSGAGEFSAAGVTDERLLHYINKPIVFSPTNYPELPRYSIRQVQSGNSHFGSHGSNITSIDVPANYPLHVYSLSGKRVTRLSCHKLIAARLKAALTDIANHYGPDMMSVAPGACIYHGGFVDRQIRGGSSWSSHAFGIAFDFDADNNGMYVHSPKARLSQAIYGPFWKIWYHHGFYSQGIETDLKKTRRGNAADWMHVQFAHYGTP